MLLLRYATSGVAGVAQPALALAAADHGAITLAEPGTLVLLGLGLLAIAGVRHWRARGDRKLEVADEDGPESDAGFNSPRSPPAARGDQARAVPSSVAPRTTGMHAETPDHPSDGPATLRN